MISYHINCFICKQNYEVNEKSKQYTAVKRNMKGLHICPECIEVIERDATIVTGINKELLEELEQIKIDKGL